jgi:hypothetical protein
MKKIACLFGAAALMLSPVTQVSAFGGFGGGIPGLGGGGDGGSSTDWGALESDADTVMSDLYEGTKLLISSSASMYEAIGLKELAANARGIAKKLEDEGSFSGSIADEAAAQSKEGMIEVSAKLKEAGSLDANQKSALGKAFGQYVVGGLKYIKGLKKGKDVVSKAKDAPMTKVATFVGVVKAVPTAVKGAESFFGKVPEVIKLMKTADITLPADASELTI